MILTVLGTGAMTDDRCRWFRGDDLSDDLLKETNTLFLGSCITKKVFERQEVNWVSRRGVCDSVSRTSDPPGRWQCFHKTLALRSQGVCATLLCSSSFDFTEDEWATLENSAKHAAEACYSPTRVGRLLGRNFVAK
jgi:hypothetical protein